MALGVCQAIVYLLLLHSLVMISVSTSEGLSGVYSKLRGLKLIAFDLDGTIWTPGNLRSVQTHLKCFTACTSSS